MRAQVTVIWFTSLFAIIVMLRRHSGVKCVTVRMSGVWLNKSFYQNIEKRTNKNKWLTFHPLTGKKSTEGTNMLLPATCFNWLVVLISSSQKQLNYMWYVCLFVRCCGGGNLAQRHSNVATALCSVPKMKTWLFICKLILHSVFHYSSQWASNTLDFIASLVHWNTSCPLCVHVV